MSVKKIGKCLFCQFFCVIDGTAGEYYFQDENGLDEQCDYNASYGKSDKEPIPIFKEHKHMHWLYKNNVYKFDRPDYSDHEMLLQIMALEDRERKKFERLKHKFSVKEGSESSNNRERIPEEVRIAVWRRDEGKCVKCGSRENLEYDHIIPISKGGSNTVRNIELLCEKCNREKSNNI
jgi:hypothetical protein